MEEIRKVYLDTSVFLDIFLGTPEVSRKSERTLQLVKAGMLAGFTSTLTYDEIFWKIKKMRSRADAIRASEIFLNLQNVKFIDITLDIIWAAHNLLQKYELAPRDAIHAAAALSKGCKMISSDEDFKKIKELKIM